MSPAARDQSEWADDPMPPFQQINDDPDEIMPAFLRNDYEPTPILPPARLPPAHLPPLGFQPTDADDYEPIPPMPIFPPRVKPANAAGLILSPSASTSAIQNPHSGLKDARPHPYARPAEGAHPRVAGPGKQHNRRILAPAAEIAQERAALLEKERSAREAREAFDSRLYADAHFASHATEIEEGRASAFTTGQKPQADSTLCAEESRIVDTDKTSPVARVAQLAKILSQKRDHLVGIALVKAARTEAPLVRRPEDSDIDYRLAQAGIQWGTAPTLTNLSILKSCAMRAVSVAVSPAPFSQQPGACLSTTLSSVSHSHSIASPSSRSSTLALKAGGSSRHPTVRETDPPSDTSASTTEEPTSAAEFAAARKQWKAEDVELRRLARVHLRRWRDRQAAELKDEKRYHEDQQRRAAAGVLEQQQHPVPLPQPHPLAFLWPYKMEKDWVHPPLEGGPGPFPDHDYPTNSKDMPLSLDEWHARYPKCVGPLVQGSYLVPRKIGDPVPWITLDPSIGGKRFFNLLVPPVLDETDASVSHKHSMPGSLINRIYHALDAYVATGDRELRCIAAAVAALWITYPIHGRDPITKMPAQLRDTQGRVTVNSDFYQRCAFEVADRIMPGSVKLPSKLAVCTCCTGLPSAACFFLAPVTEEDCFMCWIQDKECSHREISEAAVLREITDLAREALDIEHDGTPVGPAINEMIERLHHRRLN